MVAVMSKEKRAKPEPVKGSEDGGPVMYIRLPPALRQALQDYMDQDPLEQKRQQIGVDAVTEYLAKREFWPPKKE